MEHADGWQGNRVLILGGKDIGWGWLKLNTRNDPCDVADNGARQIGMVECMWQSVVSAGLLVWVWGPRHYGLPSGSHVGMDMAWLSEW